MGFVLLAGLLLAQARETIDLFTGIQQRKIQVKVAGDGIDSINVEVSRPAGSKPAVVKIPTGTLFAAGSPGVQSMVAIGSRTADLTSALSALVSVPVACANLHLDVPSADNSFTVQQAPNQQELQAVVPFLDRAGAGYTVTQAAVWIITDNADYDDLGTLISGPFGGSGSRDINHLEAAQAMMTIEKAKVDLTERAIWRDRVAICEEVVGTPGETGTWCTKVLRDTTDVSWKINALDHAKRAVRDAARAGLLRAADPASRAAILEALPGAGDAAATVLAQALGNFSGPDVTAGLVQTLARTTPSVRLAAVQSLGKAQGTDALDPLTAVLDPSETTPLRVAATRALCAFPPQDVEPKIVGLLTDRLAALRAEAAKCLGTIGTAETIPSVEPLLKDPQTTVRAAAAAALKSIRTRAR